MHCTNWTRLTAVDADYRLAHYTVEPREQVTQYNTLLTTQLVLSAGLFWFLYFCF